MGRRAQATGRRWLDPSSRTRYPVILTPDGPISLPAKLEQLSKLERLPNTVGTAQVDLSKETEIKRVANFPCQL